MKELLAGIVAAVLSVFGGHQAVTNSASNAAAAAASVAPSAIVATSSVHNPASVSTPPTIINQPVIERIVERTVQTAAPTGYVTQEAFTTAINELSDRFGRIISGSTYPAPASNFGSGGVWNAVALTNRIDHLSGTSLSSISVSGVSGLTDADIPDGITASNYLPLSGGVISGSTTIPYTPTYTDGTLRTVFQKLDDAVSVKDFGAKCDGTTDDSGAFRAALATGKTVSVPKCDSSYVISSTVTYTTSALAGKGARLMCEAGSTLDSRVANGPAIKFYSTASAKFQEGIVIDGCEITTTTSPASSNGIELSGVIGFRISNNYIHDLTGHGIVLTSVDGDNDGVGPGTIESNRIKNNGGNGIQASNPGYTTAISAVDIVRNRILGNVHGIAIRGHSIFIRSNSIGTNSGNGVLIAYDATGSSRTVNISGGEYDRNESGDIYIEAAISAVVDSVRFTRSGGNNPYGIKIGDGTHLVSSATVRGARVRIDNAPAYTAFLISAAASGTRIENPEFESMQSGNIRYSDAGSSSSCMYRNVIVSCDSENPTSTIFDISDNGGRTLRMRAPATGVDTAGIFQIGTSALFHLSNTSGSISVDTADVSRMTIANGGNVGIGTTTPYGILSISNSASTPGATPLFVIASTTGGTATTTFFTVTNTGNVGINTSNPTTPLQVLLPSGATVPTFTATTIASFGRSAGSAEIAITSNTASQASIFFGDTAASQMGMIRYDNLTDTLAFGTAAVERARITATGFGIATTTPWRTLSVTGTVGFDGLTGSTGAGSLCLSANREVVYNSGSDSCLSSTRITKHDILPLALSALDMVNSLQPVSFIYNNDASSTVRYGFIAEDTAAVDSHLATYDAQGAISGIDDRSIISVVVKALQQIASRISSFADSFTTKELTFIRATGDEIIVRKATVQELCVGSTCLTESQVQALLNQAGQQPSAPSETPQETEEPQADEPIPEASDAPEEIPATEPAAQASEPEEPDSSIPEASDAPPIVPSSTPEEIPVTEPVDPAAQ